MAEGTTRQLMSSAGKVEQEEDAPDHFRRQLLWRSQQQDIGIRVRR
jgi:hypothetical protein